MTIWNVYSQSSLSPCLIHYILCFLLLHFFSTFQIFFFPICFFSNLFSTFRIVIFFLNFVDYLTFVVRDKPGNEKAMTRHNMYHATKYRFKLYEPRCKVESIGLLRYCLRLYSFPLSWETKIHDIHQGATRRTLP